MTIWWHASKKQQFAAWIYHSLNRVKSVLRKQIVFPTSSTARSLKDFEHEFMVHLKPFLDTGSKLIVCADFVFDLFTGDKDFLNFMTLNLKCEQIGTKKKPYDHSSNSLVVKLKLLRHIGLITKLFIALLKSDTWAQVY